MPLAGDEFAVDELCQVLAESRGAAEDMLGLAHHLEVKLPGTREAFRSGVLRESKAAVIARACEVLDPAEARAAEALVLDRAGRTPARYSRRIRATWRLHRPVARWQAWSRLDLRPG